jgi:hypothetical protein
MKRTHVRGDDLARRSLAACGPSLEEGKEMNKKKLK